MVRKTTSNKSGEHANAIKQPFRFMNLPPELRVQIYRSSVVNKPGDSKNTLRPPVLAQVCSQIRAEVLPIYYGENSFYISMDIDIIGYEEDFFPVREDDDRQLHKFLDMCSAIISTGGLKFVTDLDINYSEPVFEDMRNYLLGFEFIGNARETSNQRSRIGDDNLNWSDSETVTKAFNDALERSVYYGVEDLRHHVPVSNVIKVLLALAKHCHAANQYVRLSWDYGH